MLKLYIKDNANGQVHEYGTSHHDALILQEDGSLYYENLQSCAGTKFPEEGYNFCREDGTVPGWDERYEVEPYIDIAGEFYAKPKWIPVADRLPEKGKDVLVVVFDGYDTYIDMDSIMTTGEWLFEMGDRHVTHWMPLPAMPEVSK